MFIPRDVGLWLIKWSRKRRACWMFLALISLSRSRSELIMGEKSVSVRNALVETMKFLCWTVITTPSREWSWIVITVNTYHSALPSLQIFSFSHDSTVFFWVVLEIRRPGWQGMDFWWPTLLELPPSEFFSELFTTVVFFKSGVSCSLGENSITVNDRSFHTIQELANAFAKNMFAVSYFNSSSWLPRSISSTSLQSIWILSEILIGVTWYACELSSVPFSWSWTFVITNSSWLVGVK